MNYEDAAKKYCELRDEVERIEKDAKAKKAEIKKIMVDIENWFTLKAQEEGLKTIPTTCGTAYWTVHSRATVADPDVFRRFVIDNSAWDLMETRASSLAVKSYVEAHGAPPPAINYSTVRVFNLRQTNQE